MVSVITRSPAQKPACKGHGRNDQPPPAITSKAAYTPVSNRAGSRSQNKKHHCCQGRLHAVPPWLQ
ncbi:alpha-galactosidase [Lacticaseibacillus paracasei]|nr:alpha-galactosidase [Lacticaseibacillus paracasei]